MTNDKPWHEDVGEEEEEEEVNWDEFEEIQPDTSDIIDPDEGYEFVGEFLKTEEDVGANNSKLHHFEVNEKNIALWGCQTLDDRMSRVNPGDIVAVRYDGKKKSEKTGREYKVYKVGIKARN